MQDQQAMGAEMAQRTADATASMYCRNGDADDRDRLLGALYDLNDGAYMNRRNVAFCRSRIELARKLIPRVRPHGPDDRQIASAKDTLYVAGPQCLARAGDCKSAWATFEQLYPRHHLGSTSPAQQDSIMRSAFDSIVSTCKGKPVR
jgi:hypothetical protein